jgi:hypothetical protein
MVLGWLPYLSELERSVVAALLPRTPLTGATTGSDGSHRVVLLPGIAAVRIVKTSQRRMLCLGE